MEKTSLEEYKERVDYIAGEIEKIILEGENSTITLRMGAVDALLTTLRAAMENAIVNPLVAEEGVVGGSIEKSIGWLACGLSDKFEERFGEGKTLFGFSPKAERAKKSEG